MNKFYEFDQNNSGGEFEMGHDSGVAPTVIIEAENADAANSKAEEIGIYFDGCDKGMDCECCGDRWHPVDEYCGEPSLDSLIPFADSYQWAPDGENVVIYWADGEVEWL